MKLKFNSELPYQQEALDSVVNLFAGMPREHGTYTELGIANSSSFITQAQANGKLLENLQSIQTHNNIEHSTKLIAEDDNYPFPNFSVEMETGTGKTYVYLRTIFKLHKEYGLRKFIIVVPSVPIREGVLASIELMREHFHSLFENVPFDHYVYKSNDPSKVRQFATSNTVQI